MTNKKLALPGIPEDHLIIFQEKAIRRTWHKEAWWFAIVDVVSVLTDSVQPDGYVKDLRRRDKELAKGWGQIATPLRVETEGGVQRVNCANTEGLFRIIQSIPQSRAFQTLAGSEVVTFCHGLKLPAPDDRNHQNPQPGNC